MKGFFHAYSLIFAVLIINNGPTDKDLPAYLTEALKRFATEGGCRNFIHADDIVMLEGRGVSSATLFRKGFGESTQFAVLDMFGKIAPKVDYLTGKPLTQPK